MEKVSITEVDHKKSCYLESGVCSLSFQVYVIFLASDGLSE